jgi:ferredoxin-NADP reductase
VHTLHLRARDVVAATPRTRIIKVGLDGHEFRFHAGQAVFAGLADGQVKRPYSIACSPLQTARDDMIELLVQIDDHRAPDPHLERAGVGTLLRIAGPIGSFGLSPPRSERQLMLIAGGTGIAPLRSILWDTLEQQPPLDITLVYSARQPEEFAYREELLALARDRRLELFLTVTRGAGDDWTGTRGRIDEALITRTVKTRDVRCAVCGPVPFVADVLVLLRNAGVPAERIVTETYSG